MRFFIQIDASNKIVDLAKTESADVQPAAGFIEVQANDPRLVAFLSTIGENAPRRRVIPVAAFFDLLTNAELSAFWAFLAGHPQALGQIILALADGQLDLTGAKAKAICDALVAGGVITAAREVQILAGIRQQLQPAAAARPGG